MKKGVFIIGVNAMGESVSSSSARISTTGGNAIDVLDKATDSEKNRNLIRKVLNSGHASISEHTVFSLAFCDVSVLVEQFMIEFRLASFTVKSRRYVNFGKSGFYIPSNFSEEQRNTYISHMESLFLAYNKLIENDIPKEDARFLLPYSFYSNFYVTVNARELKHILTKMLFGHGSQFPEIRELGEMLLQQALEVAPCFFDSISKERVTKFQSNYEIESIEKKEMIEVLQFPENPKRILAIANSLSKGKTVEIDRLSDEDYLCIIEEIFESERPRELEQLFYTIKFNNLSLSSITHLVRHRMQSIIVPSLLSVNNEKYIIPKTISENPQLLETYNLAFADTIKVKEDLLRQGVQDYQLVYFALSGNTLDVMTTINARELLLFFKLRTCNRAQ